MEKPNLGQLVECQLSGFEDRLASHIDVLWFVGNLGALCIYSSSG